MTPDFALTNGDGMHALMRALFPICRSITGQGVRDSLEILKHILPIETHEVASGTQVFDWQVPNEWNIRDAYIADEAGHKIIDFQQNNLHVVSYSEPVDLILNLEQLQKHLHSLPDQPDIIPYRTSYYNRTWGFCLCDTQRQSLTEQNYHVVIDSTLAPGHLTYGEVILPGETDEEVILSTNICHPSMANNELSGVVMVAALAQWLMGLEKRRYTYRLLWLPETIGAITYLAKHRDHLKNKVIAGYQVVCVGGPDNFVYLQSRAENQLCDRVALNVLKHLGQPYRVLDYTQRASDERQWCSPNIDLPLGSVMRSKYHDYPQYHTSADDLEFVSAAQLHSSFEVYCKILTIIEFNRYYVLNHSNGCEPNLGRRGLYPTIGGQSHKQQELKSIFALTGYADGHHDLLDIAEKHNRCAASYIHTVKNLLENGLIVSRGIPKNEI